MDPHTFEIQVAIEINVIEPQHRQHSGKAAAAMGEHMVVSALEMLVEKPRGQSADPLVEIAEHDPVTARFVSGKKPLSEKLTGLNASFEDGCSQVKVEDVQGCTVSREYFHVQTATTFASWYGNVVIARMADGMTGEQNIAIGTAAMAAVFAEFAGETELVGEKTRLVAIGRCPSKADDLLQGNYVGIDFLENAKNTLGNNTPVEPTTFVNVVGGHTEPAGMVWETRPGMKRLDGDRQYSSSLL